MNHGLLNTLALDRGDNRMSSNFLPAIFSMDLKQLREHGCATNRGIVAVRKRLFGYLKKILINFNNMLGASIHKFFEVFFYCWIHLFHNWNIVEPKLQKYEEHNFLVLTISYKFEKLLQRACNYTIVWGVFFLWYTFMILGQNLNLSVGKIETPPGFS